MRPSFINNFQKHPSQKLDFSVVPAAGSSLQIILGNAGKRFNREWIFRNLNATFQQGKSYAITGPNGSGKSTLLQTISGAIAPSEGAIEYFTRLETENRKLETENVYQYISIAAPYLEVIEEMTALEFLLFHASFKPLIKTVTIPQILEIIGLQASKDKQIRFYSSGMKQRIKLAQAIFSDVPVLLLDEPCTNLDAAGYALYHQLINDYCIHKLIIVSSNDLNEYDFCGEQLNIPDWK
ncbi:MAG TPA: ABC transporter ATP-binding protein [Panacibacter sp.]|nr:ABC transporter ATP-binding protein [Panacibacter sp.]